MKAKDIVVGGHYKAKVSGNIVTVRVDAITDRQAYGGRDGYSGRAKYVTKAAYEVTNLKTGRKTTFRSAAKFRCPMYQHSDGKFYFSKEGTAKSRLEGELKKLAEQGAANLITAEEQDRRHEAAIKEEQQRRLPVHSYGEGIPLTFWRGFLDRTGEKICDGMADHDDVMAASQNWMMSNNERGGFTIEEYAVGRPDYVYNRFYRECYVASAK